MDKAPPIILASASPSRQQQLKDLGLAFQVQASNINEDPYKKLSLPPSEICQKLAQAKVEKVAPQYPSALVLGGDQMAVLNNTIYNKPGTLETAVKTLMSLQGKTHTLFTALHITYNNRHFQHLEINRLSMRKLSKAQITHYVQTTKPLQCAGSYALERCGIGLFDKIESADPSAIIGFPLITLISQLIKWKIPIPFFDKQ